MRPSSQGSPCRGPSESSHGGRRVTRGTREPLASPAVRGPFWEPLALYTRGQNSPRPGEKQGQQGERLQAARRAPTQSDGPARPRLIQTPKPLVRASLSCSCFILGGSQHPPREPGNQEGEGCKRQPVTPSLWSRDGVTVPSGSAPLPGCGRCGRPGAVIPGGSPERGPGLCPHYAEPPRVAFGGGFFHSAWPQGSAPCRAPRPIPLVGA